MDINIQIEPKTDYLLVQYRGPDSVEISREILHRSLDACEKYNCNRMMVIAFLENSLSTMENYDIYNVFKESGFSANHKMAWVDQNPDTFESTQFAETVLLNRGIRGRMFTDEEKARQWLMGDE